MLKKTLKIKGADGRAALIEFMVNKRVKYLEYLKELHSEEGMLWMNTVQLNSVEIGRYYNISTDCLSPALPSNSGNSSSTNYNSSSTTARQETCNSRCLRLPLERGTAQLLNPAAASSSTPLLPSADPSLSPPPESGYVNISLEKAPPSLVQRSTSAADWQKHHLPCYTSLAISLSDILLVPIGGAEFLESFYGLLLELEAIYANGPATKALAQRSVKLFRQHLSLEVCAALQGTAEDSAPLPDGAAAVTALTAAEMDIPVKYLFCTSQHLDFMGSAPSYDAVVPSLCSVLIFAYRKMCDYELLKSDEAVKRILSIDKRVERMVLQTITHELGKIASQKLLRETYMLSSGGVFAGLTGVYDTASSSAATPSASSSTVAPNFISDLLFNQERRLDGEASSSSPDEREDCPSQHSSGEELDPWLAARAPR